LLLSNGHRTHLRAFFRAQSGKLGRFEHNSPDLKVRELLGIAGKGLK
jgi:hypothetical protein